MLMPRPGDLGFFTVAGRVGGWINIVQAIFRDACLFTHVFVVVDAHTVVEAMPGGALYAPLDDRLTPGYAYAAMPLTDEQRAMVPAIAEGMTSANGGKGVPYSFLTYLALSLHHWHVPFPRLKKIVGSKKHMICSQLADEVLRRVGHHVFTDGRWEQNVTPGALYYATDPRVIKSGSVAQQ